MIVLTLFLLSLAAAQRVKNEEHTLIAAYVDRLQGTPG